VLVMCVRVVRVPVPVLERGVAVRMAVRFFAIPLEIVFVPKVFIVHMGMRVRHRMMKVFVHMLFCQVQPYAKCHECAGHQQRQRQHLAHEQCQHGCPL